MRAMFITLAGATFLALGVLVYSGIGYFTTVGKIKETCREALAFEHPTETTKRICYRYGFYR